jgi:hypothetical protein
VEVRPEVTLTPPVGVSPSACAAQATAEVFDNFSKTAWVVVPGLVPPGPPVMPIYLGPVGLTFEQTARLNVVAHPPNPCIGTIGFITERQSDHLAQSAGAGVSESRARPRDVLGFDRHRRRGRYG